MTDRIAHDHPTVETVAGTLGRYGGTSRPEIRFEEAIDVADGDVIRLVLDGVEYRARVSVSADRSPVIRGAYDTPRMARNPESGTNHLAQWVANSGLEKGRTVHLDVVEPGFKYGLRKPGESATYVTGRPDDGLASIAAEIEDGEDGST